MLQLLEERATLARLLPDTTDDAPLVRIGGENTVEDLRSTSLVAQRYRVVTAGSLGVLGPTRMDYASRAVHRPRRRRRAAALARPTCPAEAGPARRRPPSEPSARSAPT